MAELPQPVVPPPALVPEPIAAEILAEAQAAEPSAEPAVTELPQPAEPPMIELPPALVPEPIAAEVFAEAHADVAELPQPAVPPTIELPPTRCAGVPVLTDFLPQSTAFKFPPAPDELSPPPSVELPLPVPTELPSTHCAGAPPTVDAILLVPEELPSTHDPQAGTPPAVDLPLSFPEQLPTHSAGAPPVAELPAPAMPEPPAQTTVELPPAPIPVLAPMPEMLALPPPPAETASSSTGGTPGAPACGSRVGGPWHDARSAAGEHWPEPPTHFAGAAPPVELQPDIDESVTLRRSLSAEFFSWLHNRLPGRPAHLPADAVEPTWTERQTSRRMAAAVAGSAVLSLLPELVLCRGNLAAAPPWALLAALLAAVQLVFAGWMLNAPDWVTARVQMVVSAAATTIYAMVMTLLRLTPDRRSLPLGLDDVRNTVLAPTWCGLICAVMAAVTWYCGHAAARWRREAEEDRQQQGFAEE